MNPVRATSFIRLDIPKLGRIIAISELGQETGSFKFRAAWNVVNQIDTRHFLAASSGNFGQALARAAQLKSKQATIVMPTTSAKVKIDAVRRFGGEVVLVDTEIESRASKVNTIHRDNPDAYKASAYDCEHVIMGNSSLGLEIADSNIDMDAVIVPIGGGGLSSGIITGLGHRGVNLSVWGAEPLLGNDAARSLRQRKLCRNEKEPPTIADGARTISLGKRNWKVLSQSLQGIFEISEEEIMASMHLLRTHNLQVEPTGALAVAAGVRYLRKKPQHVVGCVLSGGNVDRSVYELLCRQGRTIYSKRNFWR